MSELVVLVADKDMQQTVIGAFSQPRRLGIRPVTPDFVVDRPKDPGVRTRGPELLKAKHRDDRHALLLLDWEGCGWDSDKRKRTAADLEAELDETLRLTWGTRGKAIVIAPELDVWMWGSDSILQNEVNWSGPIGIRDWLTGLPKPFAFDAAGKPNRPKEALSAVLKQCRSRRTPRIYEQVASKISLAKCIDPAFGRLRETLREWFPEA